MPYKATRGTETTLLVWPEFGNCAEPIVGVRLGLLAVCGAFGGCVTMTHGFHRRPVLEEGDAIDRAFSRLRSYASIVSNCV